ncbi:GNAT family acetyltransferase [Legionella geestiana]|uniref:GNAT family acetyltransferase n=2 Tax=Legionella geestiana TaxID=45065 RepID=A0A0W0U872_9GAMM|nr:SDR family NAD(P)-dependent oxidoreductase [Legionella geestiana]KTD03705.1 GNAT family acetyltransferase [Legionella geestiana]STX53807.1 Acyl-CoA N-acyltransferase [Legionella geestiana]
MKTITVEKISGKLDTTLCQEITADLPEYFGLPEANVHYAEGVKTRTNFAAKSANQYIGLISMDFPYPDNANIYWMAVLRHFHRHGIGKWLISAACDFAMAHGASNITVETLSPSESDENYQKTWQFYQSVGFKPLFNLKPEGYTWNMVYMAKMLVHPAKRLELMTSARPLVIITGASSGIGAELARQFSAAGFALGLLARNMEAMERFGLAHAICIKTDVTDFPSLERAVRTLEASMGPVEGLINNAGFAKNGEFTNLTQKDHRHMVEVNLIGTLNALELILPGMQARKKGTIINITSLADRHARPALATYAATKAGVRSLSESLQKANAKHGIRVYNVAPAKIKTPLMVQSALTDDQVIAVEDMAKTILWIYQQPLNICIRDLVIAPTCYEE